MRYGPIVLGVAVLAACDPVPAETLWARLLCTGANGEVRFDSDTVRLNYVRGPRGGFLGGGSGSWHVVYNATKRDDIATPEWYSFKDGVHLEITGDCTLFESRP